MVDDNTTPSALEYDETFNDNDSALGDADLSTQTQTLASSIYNYRVENGRYAPASKHVLSLTHLEPTTPSATAATGALTTNKPSNIWI
jgi:hypothetical protein